MLIYYFANLQKLYIFSRLEETYVAKVIKIVAATCDLNLLFYDMLKGKYYFWGLFFLIIYSPGDGDAVLWVTEIISKMVFRNVYNKRI